MNWFKTLQVTVIVLIGFIVVEGSFWIALTQDKFWVIPGTAIITYISILSGLFFGKDDSWVRATSLFLYLMLLSTFKRAGYTFLVLVISSTLIGIQVWRLWSEQKAEQEVKEKEPNFLVELYSGSRTNPVQNAFVTLRDLLSKWEETKPLEENGLAFFRVKDGRMCQLTITMERGGNSSAAKLAVDQNISLPYLKSVNINEIRTDDWLALHTDTKDPSSTTTIRSESVSQIQTLEVSSSQKYGDFSMASNHLPWGEPNAEIIIYRKGYVLGYDPARRIPRWTAYRLNFNDTANDRNTFAPDPLLSAVNGTTPNDYSGSGYDRGHLISPKDINGYGLDAISEANYMSTIAPQTPELIVMQMCGAGFVND
jgi:hypothetical protein